MSNEEKTEKKYKVCKYVDGEYYSALARDLTLEEAKDLKSFAEEKLISGSLKSYEIEEQN